ncbi:hypothetical protein [uncultured Microscilla sp.]|uniref:hypothetical protein n=1 Tax=uncultured Microscilla sp. TaxID=432653 RepID=UPI0026022F90|nr:hypothetical protein [uncultured Microscilla sp.]
MKTKNRLFLAIVTVAILGTMWACKKQEQPTPPSMLSEKDKSSMTQLGKQLDNPYSVENMRKAWSNLKVNSPAIAALKIAPTHLYVRFKPANDEELTTLKNDELLDLYDYPLDREVTKQGSFYHDPSIPVGQPTYQYCAVKVDQELPAGIKYKVLAQLFIPDATNDDQGKNQRVADTEVADALVNEALRITNNLNTTTIGRTTAKSWRPAGRIRVWDDNLNTFVALQGVEVKARRWFTTHKGITNSQGNYSCDGTFKRDANYLIKWERYQFTIRQGALNDAQYNGPKRKGNWNLDIRNGGQEFYATIFRAAYHYYYRDIQGLRRPPQNGTLNTKMRIRAYNESNSDINGSHSEERRFLGLGNQIKMYNPQRNSRDIYGTTIHELAHASHWDLKRNDFDDSESKVKESWARGVQWILTRVEYPGYRGGATIRPRYTQVVVDLIDGNSDVNNGSENTSQDNVSGYTPSQIEDALRGQKTWNGWRNNIINRYNNSTEGNVNTLFAFWN